MSLYNFTTVIKNYQAELYKAIRLKNGEFSVHVQII